MRDVLKGKTLQTQFGTSTLKRLSAPPALPDTSQVHRPHYDGFAQMARAAGQPAARADRIAEERYMRDSMAVQQAQQAARSANRDALTLPNSNVGYATTITSPQSSLTASNNDHINSFRFDNQGTDPRADIVRRLEIETVGSATRYCCGSDTSTVAANIKAFETHRGWYAISFRECWTERWTRGYSQLFDYELLMKRAAEQVMYQAHAEVTWFGDPVNELRGLRDLYIDRMYLPTPFDQMTDNQEAYDTYALLMNYAELKFGMTRRYRQTHVIEPSGFGIVEARKNLNVAGCCDTLGEDFMTLREGRKRYRSDWMLSVGERKSTAMLIYNRENGIYVDHAVRPTWGPPVFTGAELVHTCYMRLGEMTALDPSAGLLVSNVLTAAC
jgi:hypothetical protein